MPRGMWTKASLLSFPIFWVSLVEGQVLPWNPDLGKLVVTKDKVFLVPNAAYQYGEEAIIEGAPFIPKTEYDLHHNRNQTVALNLRLEGDDTNLASEWRNDQSNGDNTQE